jgi:pimeloyl-ACP methyl ester carboxylesterase
MRPRPHPLALALTACVVATGCGLNTAVLQIGGNGRMGVLLNYSCNAGVCDPIDPAKPTIVFTHGWNPLPKGIHTTFGSASAAALKCRCGDSYNLLSWDWNGVRISPFKDEPLRVGKEQGRMMAAALRARGIDPGRTHMIGHSLGTIAVAQAAVCLQDLGCTAQLTLLDPPETYHEQIFRGLAPTCHATVVENYWSPGPSGYGAHANVAGVQNYIVRGTTPIVGIVDLSLSNHVYVMRWYYETVRNPSMRCGFQNSVLLPYCGAAPADDGEIVPVPQIAATSAGSRRR